MNDLPYQLEQWLQHAEACMLLRGRLAACGCSDERVLAKLAEHARDLADEVAEYISVDDDRVEFKDPIE